MSLFKKLQFGLLKPNLTTKYMQFAVATALVVISQISQAAPKIENWETASGLRVYFVNVPELPMLDLSLSFSAGSAYWQWSSERKDYCCSLSLNFNNENILASDRKNCVLHGVRAVRP